MLIGGAQKPPKKVYATQQEEMDAELEAAMAADAAAADTDTQDSPQAAVGYGASPGGSPKGRNGPRLELPGDGGGIDFDALDLAAPQDVSAGGDPQQARHTCMDQELVHWTCALCAKYLTLHSHWHAWVLYLASQQIDAERHSLFFSFLLFSFLFFSFHFFSFLFFFAWVLDFPALFALLEHA